MKHLKKFNEAIIDYKSENVEGFYKECKDLIETFFRITDSQLKEIAEKWDIETVDYKTFISDLPDTLKAGAPPPGILFALVNPETGKPRIVCDLKNISERELDHIHHMLKHETIHIGQKARSGGKGSGEGMDPKDQKSYFSNKDEVMAFAQSISDLLMKSNPKNIGEALKGLDRNPLWNNIKRSVDTTTLQRYKKYIYQYLEKEFES